MFAPTDVAQFALLIPHVRNDFKVLAFHGTEAINSLYAIHVELVSEYPNRNLESLLGQPAFLQFGLEGKGIHGRIEDVFAGEVGRRLTRYELTLVPSLHYLQFRHNHRIFQHETVQNIIIEVLKDHGILADAYAFEGITTPEREYCTQYGESDFEFVERLCSEDGIAWRYAHSQDGHKVIFSDQPLLQKLGSTPYQQDAGLVADHPVVSRFSMRLNTRTNQVIHREYDFKFPRSRRQSRYRAQSSPVLEDYRYPAPFRSEKLGSLFARHAAERHGLDQQMVEGKSDQPNLRSGRTLQLIEHPREQYNCSWLLHSVTHSGKQPQVLEESISSETNPDDGFTQGYHNTFSAAHWTVLYRPPLVKRKTVMVSQTAYVTGPEGDEIFCDEFGRVKVQFHWDRANLNSDKSSCWLRVSSNWAGQGFGSVTIPRIGMEVVVTFMEGNPDKPLITGCVPNPRTVVPYPLPTHKTKTVLRSHSSPHNGGYSELSIDDMAGQEKVYLRAQRDIEQRVLNDSEITIDNDRREHVSRDSHSLIGNDRTEQVDNNSSSLIKGDELHTTQGVRNTVIGGNELISITGNSSTTADGTLVIQAGMHAHVTANNVVINAGTSLTLVAGGQHIVLCAAGIFSSVPIVQGGSPVMGVPAQLALSVMPVAAEALAMPSLTLQASALLQAARQATPICAVCQKLAELNA